MHVKDAVLYFAEGGLARQPRACGEGIIEWAAILPILFESAPDLHLSIEDHRGFMLLEIYDPEWLNAHPDLTTAELAQVVHLAQLSEEKIARGEIIPLAAYDAEPWSEQKIRRLEASRDYLRSIIAARGLHDPTPAPQAIAAASTA
jgi:hypothetical protein